MAIKAGKSGSAAPDRLLYERLQAALERGCEFAFSKTVAHPAFLMTRRSEVCTAAAAEDPSVAPLIRAGKRSAMPDDVSGRSR